MKSHPIMLSFVFFLFNWSAYSQQGGNISWSTRIEKISLHEGNIIVSARIQPGWHLYSQHLGNDGPQPTRITFERDDRYALSGFAERGDAHTYYDDIYEMNVTWYSNSVDFVGRLKVADPVMRLTGTVEYMICNLDMCIPEKVEIAVPVDLTEQEP